MTFPTFELDSVFEDGTVTVSAQTEGFEKERAYDYFTYDAWAPGAGTHFITADLGGGNARAADFWAMLSRDLGTNGGGAVAQYSDDNFVADVNEFDASWNPAAGENLLFRKVTAATARYWRIQFTSTPGSSIIAVAIGSSLTFERDASVGFMVPTLATQNELKWNVSQTGQILGESLRRGGVEFTADFNGLTPAWVRANWATLIARLETRAAFFSWRPDIYPAEAAFVRVDIDRSAMPSYSSPAFMRASLRMTGITS